MDQKLVHIARLLAAYSTGDFSSRAKLSDQWDQSDAMISAIHALGEELEVITVPRSYLADVFDAMTDMAFVVSANGQIQDLNKAACQRLGYTKDMLLRRFLNVLTGEKGQSFGAVFRKMQGRKNETEVLRKSFFTSDANIVHVEILAKLLSGPGRQILLIARDVEPDNRLLRAVIETQVQERNKMARDLHDGIGQQLSAVKFLVSAAMLDCPEPKLKGRLIAVNKLLFDTLEGTRNFCRNLMPPSLEDFGLVKAIQELKFQMEVAANVVFTLETDPGIPDLPKPLERDLYRVVQEFSSNALNHGRASFLNVLISFNNGELMLRLKDNGKGFDTNSSRKSGMGLRNMESRVRSHQGIFEIFSRVGYGTTILIRFNGI